jgi:two-component system response regulator PilR (NtrC family)
VPSILLVEDDPDIRLLWEEVLMGADYEVDSTETVTGGCELLGSHHFDLVITDGRLGDGTGVTVADRAREKSIPVLIVTGYAFILNELKGDPPPYTQPSYCGPSKAL